MGGAERAQREAVALVAAPRRGGVADAARAPAVVRPGRGLASSAATGGFEQMHAERGCREIGE